MHFSITRSVTTAFCIVAFDLAEVELPASFSWEQGQAKRNAGSAMSWVDMIGYVGAAFVLVAYTMKTMIPLRIMAIGSNVAAITYAVVAGLKPILFLHLTLLPLNVYPPTRWCASCEGFNRHHAATSISIG